MAHLTSMNLSLSLSLCMCVCVCVCVSDFVHRRRGGVLCLCRVVVLSSPCGDDGDCACHGRQVTDRHALHGGATTTGVAVKGSNKVRGKGFGKT